MDPYMLFEMISYQFQRVRGGQSSQLRVLRFLHNHESANLKTLQMALSIKSAAMSEIVTKLEERGLITRTQSESDKRVKDLRLTDKGERVIVNQIEQEKKMNLFSCLSDEELSTLETTLRKINKDWRERESLPARVLD